MNIPDFEMATKCLHENLNLLTDPRGNVAPQNMALWNISNALLVICDALQENQTQLRRIKREL